MPPEPDTDIESTLDRSQEAPAGSDVLAPHETRAVQEDATKIASERGRFLLNSLGKAMSPSTEILKDMVVSIYDGAKKLVGMVTGERPRVDVADRQAHGQAASLEQASQAPAAELAKLEAGEVRSAGPTEVEEKAAARPLGEVEEKAPSKAASEIEEKAPPTKTKDGAVKMEPLVVTADYRGEDIRREVEPTVVQDTKGKTVKDIARDHLGKDPPPTEDEIQKHAKEIARLNKIKNPDKPLDGSPVVVPGHDKHGGMITQDAEGNRKTVYQDGAFVVQNKDGTGYDHHPNADGSGYKEHHWGPRPEDNYELRKTPDGKYEVAEAGTENFKEVAAEPPDPRVERAKLKDCADAMITDPRERAKFEADMAKFEARAKELRERYEKQGMTPEQAAQQAQLEMAKTYREIRTLMEAPDNPDLPMIKEKDRVMLATQVMHQAADPTDVSQGAYNTCNVATIEARTYTKSPSEAARLVREVATTGKYRTNGDPPIEVEVPKGSLEKHGQSKDGHTPGENHRSYASQIFEVTAVNIHYTKENAKTGGQIKYEQQKPGPDNGPNSDNGERLYDYSKNNPKTGKPPAEVLEPDGKTPTRAPGITPSEIAGIAKDICPDPKDGDQPGPVRIDFDPAGKTAQELLDLNNKVLGSELAVHGIGNGQPLDLNDPEVFKKTREAIDAKEGLDQDTKDKLKAKVDALEREKAYRNSDGIAYIRDEKQFNEALARLKAEGRLPIIVGVHTGTEPFSTDAGEAGARGGAHVVTITDYNPGPPPTVSIDNQWSKDADHKDLPVSELFKSMRHRNQDARVEDLQKEVEENRKKGTVDYAKETELLFQKRQAGKLTDQELQDGVAKTFEEFLKARREGKISDEKKDEVLAKLRELREALPPEEQKKLDERLRRIREAHDQQVKAAKK
ncbi:MAG TPA: hypothetical protein V6D08_05665 [Candidatus Obscuribacterales bacterium]